MSRYSVWSVGRDGNVEEIGSYEWAVNAIGLKGHAQAHYAAAGIRRKVGITDNENPEAGDVSDRLAEEVNS